MEDNPRGLEIPYDVAFPMEEGLYIMSCTADGGWYEGTFIPRHNDIGSNAYQM
jgi:hypothetical protein